MSTGPFIFCAFAKSSANSARDDKTKPVAPKALAK